MSHLRLKTISFWFQKNKYLLGVRDEATLHFVKSKIVCCYGCSRHGVDVVRCQGTQPTYTSCPEKQNGWLCINVLYCRMHSQAATLLKYQPTEQIIVVYNMPGQALYSELISWYMSLENDLTVWYRKYILSNFCLMSVQLVTVKLSVKRPPWWETTTLLRPLFFFTPWSNHNFMCLSDAWVGSLACQATV